MAIYGAGSLWNDRELKNDFFNNSNYQIGWDISVAQDLYNLISTITVGDIIYLKANRPGSLDLRIKGIGIVTESLFNELFNKDIDLSNQKSDFKLPVKWIIQKEFKISIPKNSGKLTNIRAATFYEENSPFVQSEIINSILSKF